MKNIFIIFTFGLFINLFAQNTKIVAIDIGHTPKKYGAMSARGVSEYEFNKRIAIELKTKLDELKIKSFIINREGKEIKLKDRTNKAKEKNATLFISLHHDSAQLKYFYKWTYRNKKLKYSDNFSGYSLFISKSNINAKENLRFANLVADNLLKNRFNPSLHHAEKIKGENRTLINKQKGIYRFDQLVVLRTAKMPAILIECGVIVNRNSEKNLNKKSYRKKIVNSIATAIRMF